MSLLYVIDAYNIINHPAFPRQTRTQDVRIALIDFIRAQKPCGNPKVNNALLVFDGYANLPFREETGIEVIFSKDRTADEYIIKILGAAKSPRDIIVVSDDKEIQSAARYARAGVLGVEEFIAPKPKGKRQAIESIKAELSYSQIYEINKELRKVWLK